LLDCCLCFVCFLVPFTELFRHTTYLELLVKPEILTSYIYMDLRLATLNSVSFYLPHNVSTLNQCRKFTIITDGI
jgi:hypothetical protein